MHRGVSVVVEVELMEVLVLDLDDESDVCVDADEADVPEGFVAPPLATVLLIEGPLVTVLNDEPMDSELVEVDILVEPGVGVIKAGILLKPFVSEPNPSPTVIVTGFVKVVIAVRWLDWDGRVNRTHRTTVPATISTAMTPAINATVVFDRRLMLFLKTPMWRLSPPAGLSLI